MNIGIVAGSILLCSLFVPWTVTWGTQTIGFSTSYFYVFEFPFMRYYEVYSSFQGKMSWWEAYEFAPKYLGITLIVIGGILAIIGSTKQKRSALVGWGGISSTLALIFFMGCDSAEISIPYPIAQTYTIVPLGLFIPAFFWLLTLFYLKEKAAPLKETSKLFCGQCGEETSLGFNLCPFCGAKIIKPVCPVCGREVLIEHNFCPFCGAKIPK